MVHQEKEIKHTRPEKKDDNLENLYINKKEWNEIKANIWRPGKKVLKYQVLVRFFKVANVWGNTDKQKRLERRKDFHGRNYIFLLFEMKFRLN